MLSDAQRSEPMDNDKLEATLQAVEEFLAEQRKGVEQTTLTCTSSQASITGGPDQQHSLDVVRGPSTEFSSSGGGALRSNDPSQSAPPANPTNSLNGRARFSGPSDGASDGSDSQPDGSTNKKPGFMQSAYQAVQSLGTETVSIVQEPIGSGYYFIE